MTTKDNYCMYLGKDKMFLEAKKKPSWFYARHNKVMQFCHDRWIAFILNNPFYVYKSAHIVDKTYHRLDQKHIKNTYQEERFLDKRKKFVEKFLDVHILNAFDNETNSYSPNYSYILEYNEITDEGFQSYTIYGPIGRVRYGEEANLEIANLLEINDEKSLFVITESIKAYNAKLTAFVESLPTNYKEYLQFIKKEELLKELEEQEKIRQADTKLALANKLLTNPSDALASLYDLLQ